MIYYLGYYHCDQIRNEDRIVAPASENKMNYIIEALSQASGEKIEVVSPAETRLCRFVKGNRQTIDNRFFLKTVSSFSGKNKLIRAAGHLLSRLDVYFYLFRKVRHQDQIIAYHSLAHMRLLTWIKRIKKCRVIMEVEELYADVTNNEALRKKEIQYLQMADAYVYITELLRKEIDSEKPYAISHGTYRANHDHGFRFDDGKTHIVYAGTFRKAKGGVYIALPVAKFLDDRYVLEILGSGTDQEIQDVKDTIAALSGKTTCRINYVGFKLGEELSAYIQACHIGLSTQQADAKFNATSFPSKVLMYMSNGLRVVSVGIPAVQTSKVGEYLYYYTNQDAKEIADVIKTVTFDDGYDSKKCLDALHDEFTENLKLLLGKTN